MKFKIFDPVQDSINNIPESKGVFIVLLKRIDHYFIFESTGLFPDFSNYEIGKWCYPIAYIGSSVNLRSRIWNQCLNGTADKMTLRKSIGVLMGLKFDQTNGYKRFIKPDETTLSEWMRENLMFLYCDEQESLTEVELIAKFNPPFNIKNNTNPVNAEFREKLSGLRNEASLISADVISIADHVSPTIQECHSPNEKIDCALSTNNESHDTDKKITHSSTPAKYSKTRIALGIVVILVILYSIFNWIGNNSVNADGKTQYVVTQDFLAAVDNETAQTLNAIKLENPNEPELLYDYAAIHWAKLIDFYQGDVVVVLKEEGYGCKVKRLSDGMKGIIPKRMLSKKR